MKEKEAKISRRELMKSSLMASSSALLFGSSLLVASGQDIQTKAMPLAKLSSNKSVLKLMELLSLKYPIIQAPTGGVVTSELVSAVSNTGGLGGLPLSWSSPESAEKSILAVRAKTSGNFFANFVLRFQPKALDKCLSLGVKTIQFSWGMPTSEMVREIKKAKCVLGIQVTSEASAKYAISLGADYLVCQGLEAGGHVHASRCLDDALRRVLPIAGDIPVVASGGISTGKKMARYISMGAAGVVMGTRFVASKESGAHQEYKRALVKAKPEDTVFTTCMNKGWNNGTHRIIRNSTFKNWEAMGCSPEGNRPGENDVIASYAKQQEITRYSISPPSSSVQGDLESMAQYAGKGVDEIQSVLPAAQIIENIWQECLATINA